MVTSRQRSHGASSRYHRTITRGRKVGQISRISAFALPVNGKQNRLRPAFMTAYSFLGLNGYDFDAAETEVVATIERLAAGEVTEARLAEWFRKGL